MWCALYELLAGRPAVSDRAALGLPAIPACQQGIVTLQSCGAGYACAPLSRQQLATHFGSSLPLAVGDIGACVYAPAVRRPRTCPARLCSVKGAAMAFSHVLEHLRHVCPAVLPDCVTMEGGTSLLSAVEALGSRR